MHRRTFVSLLLLAACDQTAKDIISAESTDPLLGNVTSTQSCVDQSVDDDIATLTRYGRIISRSNAHLDCMHQIFEEAIFFPLGGETYGPYKACGTGPDCLAFCFGVGQSDVCKCDALFYSTPSDQWARLTSAAGSRNPVLQDCIDNLPMGGASARNQGLDGTVERWVWKSLAIPPDLEFAPAVAWHEAMHNHDYHHGANEDDDAAEGCGFDFADYTKYNAATAIVAGCMREVLKQSTNNCASNVCAPNELSVVRDFGSTDCECVPDVFANENEDSDRFGDAQAVGDFDNDGYDDLAVSSTGDSNGAGVIYIFRGGKMGLRPKMRFSQSDITVWDGASSTTFALAAEAGDNFGLALATGDFDGDNHDDLAIGAPGEKLSDAACSAGSCGYVVIIPGSADGLQLAAAQGLGQWSLGANESGDSFGRALAVGNFDADTKDDLAVGAPDETYNGAQSGVVFIYRGVTLPSHPNHLVSPVIVLTQNLATGAANENGDDFGWKLAAGNFHSDDTADELAIGAPGEDASDGHVFIAERVSGSWSITSHFANPYNSGASTFGYALAVGDVVGASTADLVVGAPLEDTSRGAAYVYEGQSSGQVYRSRLAETVEPGDRFGDALSIGPLIFGGKSDLAVGVPLETPGSDPWQGVVMFFSGSSGTALSYYSYRKQDDFFQIEDDSVLPQETYEVLFGSSLAIGDFDDDASSEVAIGAPLDIPGLNGAFAGAVFIFGNGQLNDIVKLDQVTSRYGEGSY